MNQPPLNPDGVRAAEELMIRTDRITKINYLDAERIISAYLAAALPEVTSVEELEALPQGSVIRSVVFGVVRERFDSGWLATGGEGFDQSSDIAGRAHVVLYRPEANDA